jgi:hypothetical protein
MITEGDADRYLFSAAWPLWAPFLVLQERSLTVVQTRRKLLERTKEVQELKAQATAVLAYKSEISSYAKRAASTITDLTDRAEALELEDSAGREGGPGQRSRLAREPARGDGKGAGRV